MDDLNAGINDWRNIQDVVRETFKAIHEVVRVQGEKIQILEHKMASKAGASELKTLEISCANKPTFGEMQRHFQEFSLRTAVESKHGDDEKEKEKENEKRDAEVKSLRQEVSDLKAYIKKNLKKKADRAEEEEYTNAGSPFTKI